MSELDLDINECELRELGLVGAADELAAKKELKRKLMIAYENYKFVTPAIVTRFNEELARKTRKETATYFQYDTLAFIPLKQYTKVPPKDVLGKIREAIGRGCFDAFEVAKIEAVQERKDPIVFGRVTGCEDRFFVAQWDNDVKIEDLLQGHEG